MRLAFLGWAGMAIASAALASGDWPMWAGTPSHNMASDEKGLPTTFNPGRKLSNGQYDPVAARNLKWSARLGTITCGSPVVAGGRIYVGTNNGWVRDARFPGDYAWLLCFEEESGTFLWQLPIPEVPSIDGLRIFFPQLGMCSTPTVEGDRLYLLNNRCEVVCLGARGLAGGNQGPFTDEATYFAPPAQQKLGASVTHKGKTFEVTFGQPLVEVTPTQRPLKLAGTDADVVWRYDMMNKLSIWPHEAAASSVLIHGDLLFIGSGNGVDISHRHVPSPAAPTLVAINKQTGALAAADDLRLGPRILHGTWSSPTLATVGQRTLVVMGGPDGVCYAFDANPTAPAAAGGVGKLETAWWYDCNPPVARYKDRPISYPTRTGPSEIIATPVFYKDRVYVAIGQDTRHGPAPGRLTCIDATGSGDITDKGKIWEYNQISRTLSTVSIADGLLYVIDVAGKVHCLDAETGRVQWTFETNSLVCGSTLVADGKVYFGTEKGDLWILAAGPKARLLAKVNLGSPIHTTPVAARGVLYVATCSQLFAFQDRGLTGAATQPDSHN